jgi:hypothetical protein
VAGDAGATKWCGSAGQAAGSLSYAGSLVGMGSWEQLPGSEIKIVLRTGGLAASPPVRYTLKMTEQCRVR